MRNNLKRIREAAKSISAWGSRYGTYAPLEQALTDLATEVDNKASQIFDLRMAIERLTAEVNLRVAVCDEARKIVRGEQWSQVPLKEAVDALDSGSSKDVSEIAAERIGVDLQKFREATADDSRQTEDGR